QAAQREPGVPYPLAEALAFAEEAKDSAAMEWAAGGLLAQDWPVGNKELQSRALQKLEALAKALEKDGRQDEARRMLESVAKRRQRDLVIKLSWQGEADLDVQVEEPTASVCSVLNRQTIGGGTVIGDSVGNMTSETYVAARGFSGEYRVRVERVWGRPLGDKAQLKIIRHQGTPEETEELVTVSVKSNLTQPVLVKLAGGRRTETAYVPPPSALEPPDTQADAGEGTGQVLNKLRALADPEMTGYERGGAYAPGARPVARPSGVLPKRSAGERTLYQTRVAPFVSNTADVTAQAVISADRRYVRLSLNLNFSGVTGVIPPIVSNPTVPGLHRP
ncbi:MAG TPA: hypothetical protein VFE78_24070, partial [Gemmataceae bacterium]|nr:hypothetical protein [Gemmataceae bacterium]